LTELEQIERVVAAVRIPANVLALATGPAIGQLEAVGVSRLSTGSGLAACSSAALIAGARELLNSGRRTYAGRRPSPELLRKAFAPQRLV
jgi:2-methylisocitrate lyase-like PEP mutase family enzyme